MACNPSPTATEFATVTSIGSSVSSSNSVTSLPATVTTIISTSCPTPVASGTVGIVCSTITRVSTIPGGQTTVQVPITVTFPVTQTEPTQTLFAPCPSNGGGQISPPTPPPAPPTATSSTTSILVETTPPPIVVTTQSSITQADGSVVMTLVTSISTLPPSSVYVPTTVPNVQSGHSGGGGNTSSNLTAIIGGTVGGFVGLIGLVALLWLCLRRRQNWDDIFEKELAVESDPRPIRPAKDRSRRFDLDDEPRPYQYGLVGHVTPPVTNSPPSSPTLGRAVSPGESGHGRNRSSLTPLMLPALTTPAGSGQPSTSSSRPSTSGSAHTLVPQRQRHSSRADDPYNARPASSHSHTHSNSSDRKQAPAPLTLSYRNPITDSMSASGSSGVNASGSPISVLEPRRPLQLMNPPLSPTSTIASARASFGGAMSSNSESAAAAKSVKGPRRQSHGGNVVVHQDGGRAQDSSAGNGGASSSAPPAYSET